MRAYSPTGALITGSKEVIHAQACISPDSFHKSADGSIDFQYLGGTIPDWDAQAIVLKDGKKVFFDANGDEWTEDQLELRDER